MARINWEHWGSISVRCAAHGALLACSKVWEYPGPEYWDTFGSLKKHCYITENYILVISFSIENDIVFAKTRSFSIENEVVFAKTRSFSIENDVVFDVVFDRPVRNRPTKKLKVMNYWWIELVYHNGPNHPAKCGGLGFRSRKVRFRLVNRVSLIFKGGGLREGK